MSDSEKISGVIDRIEDQMVTILIENNDKEYKINKTEIPELIGEGDWVVLEVNRDKIINIIKDDKKTTSRKNAMENKLNQLRSKSKGSRFKKK